MLRIRKTSYAQNPEKALDNDSGERYLCVRGTNIFISDIRIIARPDATLPVNCSHGCLYVDDVTSKCCVPIDKLDEMYVIEEERSNESVAETLKNVFRACPDAVLDMLDAKDVAAWLSKQKT
jgi:hypothetical protein